MSEETAVPVSKLTIAKVMDFQRELKADWRAHARKFRFYSERTMHGIRLQQVLLAIQYFLAFQREILRPSSR